MWPDRVSNPGPLTYESGALPTALRGQGVLIKDWFARVIQIWIGLILREQGTLNERFNENDCS